MNDHLDYIRQNYSLEERVNRLEQVMKDQRKILNDMNNTINRMLDVLEAITIKGGEQDA